MIELKIGGDGIVHLRLCRPNLETDERDYLDALDRIAEVAEPYAMVVDLRGTAHLSRAGELRQAAWAKATRTHISKTCRALALVRDNPSTKSQQSFSRLWSIPVHVTRDSSEAVAFARQHIAKGNVS